MRSHLLLRRTCLSTKTSSVSTRALLSYSGPARYPRKDLLPAAAPPRNTRAHRRASTTTPAPPESDPPPPSGSSGPPPEDPVEPNGRSQQSPAAPALQGHSTQNFFWSSESLSESETASESSLPPPEILDEALSHLYLSLHPQAQNRATFATADGPPVEPTLALYCPIEGGEYVIDDTVRELARRTGSDVVVLDAAHIAAGEWGHFGPAAALIELPNNPLHFPSHSLTLPSAPRGARDDDDDDEFSSDFVPSHMTLQVVLPHTASRIPGGAPSKAAMIKAKTFFEMCVNVRASAETRDPGAAPRPRIIYVRDFSTLSPSWAYLHSALLAVVRERRQGALPRSSQPVTNPTTIVFGVTPSLLSPAASASQPPGPQGMMNMLSSRSGQATPGVAASRPGKSDWGEDDHADKAREWRLRERLRRWERGDGALQHELPKLAGAAPEGEPDQANRSGVMFLGGPGGGPSPLGGLLPLLSGGSRSAAQSPNASSQTTSGFFRASVLVPASRSPSREKATRIARRREINELTMRMAVGAIGGTVEPRSAASVFSVSSEPAAQRKQEHLVEPSAASKMWDDWGNKLEAWTTVKHIADQAVGRVVSSSSLYRDDTVKPTLSPTPVLWGGVYRSWADHRASRDFRNAWTQQSSGVSAKEDQHEKGEDAQRVPQVDDIVESVKHDPYLDTHEQRLLGCIVDSVSMPTSFAQVHLPAHTIDSVRTIVSLPLLHPTAFQEGILKEHGMTGCLLFGPPGTGKTLVVRALAKEAGCRMLAISPSDVMDMYVGEGEKLVRSVFSLARRLAPCVVFIDEIDALFGARSSSRDTGGGFVHRGVITEFMQEMDGLKTSNADNVIVIGATNRPFDLDDAVLRRLPRRLLVDLPGEKEREEILKILLRDELLSPGVDVKALARDTPAFSGSDLKHVCVSAALDAVKENVSVPWAVEKTEPPPGEDSSTTASAEQEDVTQTPENSPTSPQRRVLRPHNFAKALKEITPSASESLGTLADLRRWNDEFGEGRKRKKQVWGKDRFGFSKQWNKGEDGRVAAATSSNNESDRLSTE
ncbi:hypothetical protein BC834DRAFT_223103 [Gloeopeniophorella convolvens]|nr:hypothetical protein BC834DRAFT_223103 [Gloeopeniophorella convolvens]